MKIKIVKKTTMTVAGRAGACCASCCAPVGVN
ncbi:TPA: methanobactin [Pseudomonas aeruginosa]|nr:methanobactin [Achromobacter veterisilvae]EDV5275487.1 methanobactin [Salmonella enterica subsp. enterica serovar Mbandaka]MCR6651722.1 methanobactin [Cellvibrionaceae bacterium]MDY0071289.1 methanobactin [Thauera sp.]HEN8221971.1 methanobactin [Pseudomonas aeruginosa]EDV5275489.1 methanobactin [Salmonella enterica subsp. enterica serovar Mbandaka]